MPGGSDGVAAAAEEVQGRAMHSYVEQDEEDLLSILNFPQ
jgi:hypothetical protein